MAKFVVCATWQEYGEVEVEADSLPEAIRMVEEDPDNEYSIGAFEGEYVCDSFEVDVDASKCASEYLDSNPKD